MEVFQHAQVSMLPTLSKRIPEISALALAVIVAVTVYLTVRLRDQNSWVEHTLEVKAAINDYESAMFAAESGQRGFMVAKDEIYLGPYREALTDIPQIASKLGTLTGDNPLQQSNLQRLSDATEKRLRYLATTLAARQADNDVAVKEAFSSHRGQNAMGEVRAVLHQMDATEQTLLGERRADLQKLSKWLAIAISLGLLSLVGALAFWITTSRRQTFTLTKANTDLAAAIRKSEEASAQVRHLQKMDAIGQLTGGIAHDFNNMLAVIVGGISLALRRLAKSEPGAEQFLTGALDGAQRASTLVKRLLAFARQQPLEPAPIDVNKFVSGMSELIARALGEDVRMETVLGAGLWKTYADPSQLESAILNLCINAKDAMPDGGKLTVETASASLDRDYVDRHAGVPAGQYVLIAVTDTGRGMDESTASKAFDPFFTTKDQGKGSGLGLSQVFGFVKQSGGHIKIYSELSHGTTIKIYLPRFYGETNATVARDPSENAEHKGTGSILLVEDEDAVRVVVASYLRDLGYDVLQFSNAKEALASLHNGSQIDLLLTDIVMPEVGGRKLADAAVAIKADLKVLFMTGFTRNAVVHNGTVDPGVHLLTKPFTIEQLSQAVRKALMV